MAERGTRYQQEKEKASTFTREYMLMHPAVKACRDKFIEGFIRGMPLWQAAVFAGFSKSNAGGKGSLLMCEPYVQEEIRRLREILTEEELLTKKELILNIKSLAFDYEELGSTRVGASALLARLYGHDKTKVEITGKDGGALEASVRIDPTKLSTKALNEILNATVEPSDTAGD